MQITKERIFSLRHLAHLGLPIVSGKEYAKSLKKILHKPQLKQVRKTLSKIPYSLADELIKIRNEERL